MKAISKNDRKVISVDRSMDFMDIITSKMDIYRLREKSRRKNIRSEILNNGVGGRRTLMLNQVWEVNRT